MKFLLAIFFLFFALPAQASQALPPEYVCEPANFSLDREGDGYRLTGTLDTPTPGYRYKIEEPTSSRSDLVQFPLRLIAPGGVTTMVIGSLPIDHYFSAHEDLLRVTLSIRKSFNWGPDVIDCVKPRRE